MYGSRKSSAHFLYPRQHISSHGVLYTVDEYSSCTCIMWRESKCGVHEREGEIWLRGLFYILYIRLLGRTTRHVVSGKQHRWIQISWHSFPSLGAAWSSLLHVPYYMSDVGKWSTVDYFGWWDLKATLVITTEYYNAVSISHTGYRKLALREFSANRQSKYFSASEKGATIGSILWDTEVMIFMSPLAATNILGHWSLFH